MSGGFGRCSLYFPFQKNRTVEFLGRYRHFGKILGFGRSGFHIEKHTPTTERRGAKYKR